MEIKNCPFCGSNQVSFLDDVKRINFETDDYDPAFPLYCWQCDIRGPLATKKELAVKHWNKRVKEEEE